MILELHTPPPVIAVATAVAEAGGRALIVGGSVRDHLMGLPMKDWDLEVYGLPTRRLEKVLRRLGKVNTVGRAFSVLKITIGGLVLDVSIPRRDSNAGPGHKGIHAEGDPDMSPAEASIRRDLTVNAMMVDVLTGELLDPQGGLTHLQSRTLEAVDADTFLEDPLRALRVVQFAARLRSSPTPALLELCRVARLDELPSERIREEWWKLLLKGAPPSHGLQIARDTNVLARVFPAAHLHDDPTIDVVLDRLAPTLEQLDDEGHRIALMIAGWLHTADAGAIEATFDGLNVVRWKGYPVRDRATSAILTSSDPIDTDARLRWLSTRTELDLALRLRAALDPEGNAMARHARAAELGILRQKPEPILKGRHLKGAGVAGREMGQLLALIYGAQLDGSVTDLDGALDAARRRIS